MSSDLRLILYPVARAEDGSAIHIDEWKRGQDVTCFGCGEELVGHLPHDGIKPTAHFAHKAKTACNGETALHKAAKAAIVRSHAKGTLQALAWTCPRCKRQSHHTELQALKLREEDRLCEGVVSGVLGRDPAGEPRVAIEIVVTHNLEPQPLDRYRARDLYVFALHPNWGLVGDIARGVDPLRVDYRLGAVDADACGGCQQVLREKLEWEDRERKRLAAAWWNVWIAAWQRAGNEDSRWDVARKVSERDLRVSEQQAVTAWWAAWSRTWLRIADQFVVAWWSAWTSLWRASCADYARPYAWQRAWRSVWESISTQFVAEDEEDRRRRFEARSRENTRRQVWWPAWIHVWSDITQRESGLTAAWRPICRSCRQDLTPSHRCP